MSSLARKRHVCGTRFSEKLSGLTDPRHDCEAIERVYQAAKAYRGPYRDQAPDLIVGYAGGYRVSWDAAVDARARDVFHDNTKAWSGDHCVDPSVVPGVLFCNRRIDTERPRLLDIAPTVLEVCSACRARNTWMARHDGG